MKAIAVTPSKSKSLRIVDCEKPILSQNTGTIVRVVEAGICRTDLEIAEGLYGEAPPGCDYLILGHESLGIVEEVGRGCKLSKGDAVVRMVRRPCSDMCANCASGLIDMCSTWNYTECGIKGVQGVMVELYSESEEYLIKIPKKHKDIAVLLEPLSVVEKGIRQAYEIQKRLVWKPRTALVFGAGPIGLLEAMVLRLAGMETTVVARSHHKTKKARIVKGIGARYISTDEVPLGSFAGREKFDFIYEATGNAGIVPYAWQMLSNNGVLCLSSVTGGHRNIEVDINKLNLEAVLGNKVIFGAVNANRTDFVRGVKRFPEIKRRWPGVINSLITRRLSPEAYAEAFDIQKSDIKVVLEYS